MVQPIVYRLRGTAVTRAQPHEFVNTHSRMSSVLSGSRYINTLYATSIRTYVHTYVHTYNLHTDIHTHMAHIQRLIVYTHTHTHTHIRAAVLHTNI